MSAHIEIAIAAEMHRQTPRTTALSVNSALSSTLNKTTIYHGRKWPVGLNNAAKRLGCSVGHLHMVLSGVRRGPKFVLGYNALVVELKGGAV
jgi:hypothetical protein